MGSDGNRQHGNVGNLGDILKHAALIALADIVGAEAGEAPCHYVETHAFLVHGSISSASNWRSSVEELSAAFPEYRTYAETEGRWVARGLYRCSSGLVLDRFPNANLHLAEKSPLTRARLRRQLVIAVARPARVLKDFRAFPASACGVQKGALLTLVDPFRSPTPFWPSVEKAAKALKSPEAGAALLAFSYGSPEGWPAALDGYGALLGTLDSGPYHLAAWSTPKLHERALSALTRLGWVRQRTAEDTRVARPVSYVGDSR